MSVLFDCVHSDDLRPVLNSKGGPVFPYHNVPLVSIDIKQAEARALASTQETIRRSEKHEESLSRGDVS